MLCPVPKPLGAPLHLISGSVTMADRVVLKQHPRWQEPLDRFSDHGRSGGSQTNARRFPMAHKFSNRGRSGGSQTISALLAIGCGSATVADQVVLKQRIRQKRRSMRSVTVADRTVLKLVTFHGLLYLFSNLGRSNGSQTPKETLYHLPKFSNHGRPGGSQTCCPGLKRSHRSATVAEYAV